MRNILKERIVELIDKSLIGGGKMGEVQTMSYMTNLKSIGEIAIIREILDSENEVEYWYLDINSPDNKLTIMGRDIEGVINKLKREGLIVQVD